MQARRLRIQIALVALATIGVVAVAGLFFLGDDVAPNLDVASAPAQIPAAQETQAASVDEGLGGRFLHALRDRQPTENPPVQPAETAPTEQPNQQQQALAVPETPEASAPGYIAYEVEAPQPPRRPAQLGETAQQEYPLPPHRPASLWAAEVAEASPPPALPAPTAAPAAAPPAPPPQLARAAPQPLPEPSAPAPTQQSPSWLSSFGAPAPALTAQSPEPTTVDAPQPPRRPVRLAALAEAPAAPVSAAPPIAAPTPAPPPAAASAPAASAAPTTSEPAPGAPALAHGKGRKTGKSDDKGVQVAALESQEALRPAPNESFEQEDQTPKRFNMGAPVFIRIFKKEGELELWMKVKQHYTLYRTFPICKWSGKLGPKMREADYQSPEGFYSVSAKQLNPHSNYYRAFNVGYPNAFDKQNGRTGGLVMVHGNCKSVGCFAMTDKGVEEIYGFVAAALTAGQKDVPVHIFPFRMTEAAIERETGGGFMSFLSGDSGGQRWKDFWRNLKEGYDRFEATREPPVAFACGDHYSFDANGGCQRIAGW